MTALSDNASSNSQYASNRIFAPFKIYARFLQNNVNPFAGKRWERIRAEEKVANLIEGSLRSIMENGLSVSAGDEYEFNFAFPVAYTRQFGNEPARITIVGSIERVRGIERTDGELDPPKKIAADVTHINANEAVAGQGSFNAASLLPNEVVKDLANTILDLFSDETQVDFIDYVEVMSVEVYGIMFGRNGRHFS